MKLKTVLVLDVNECKNELNHYVYRQRDTELDFIVPRIRILKEYFINAPKELILEVREPKDKIIGTYSICNICEIEGYDDVKAIAKYWDYEGDEWLVCERCLQTIKQNKLEFEMLGTNNG